MEGRIVNGREGRVYIVVQAARGCHPRKIHANPQGVIHKSSSLLVESEYPQFGISDDLRERIIRCFPKALVPSKDCNLSRVQAGLK